MCRISLLFSATAALLATTGCSGVGLLIGSQFHGQSTRHIRVEQWVEVTSLDAGTPITVTLRDRAPITGGLGELRTIGGEVYTDAFTERRSRCEEAAGLPALGDWITVSTRSGRFSTHRVQSYFLGLDSRGLLLKRSKRELPRNLPYDDLESLDGSEGRRIGAEDVLRLVSSGCVPLVAAIDVDCGSGPTQVEFANLSDISVPEKRSYKTAGLVAGLLVDCIVMAAILGPTGGSYF